jgi:prephenate dehydrogenase
LTKIYEIGPFRLDTEASVLTKAGVPVALGSRAVAVLAALVQRANEYVQKGRIIEAGWPDVVVEESNLAVQISAIRRVLAQAMDAYRDGVWLVELGSISDPSLAAMSVAQVLGVQERTAPTSSTRYAPT